MRTASFSVMLAGLLLTGCGADNTEDQSVPERKVFSTADFALLLPQQWRFLEAKSSPDHVVFQSPDGGAQLTVSVMRFNRNTSQQELGESFRRLVEHRRRAEQEVTPSPTLTEFEIMQGSGYWCTKYAGKIPESDQCTATLMTLENRKLFTLFVERQGIDAQALNTLASDIFSNFQVKEDSNQSRGGTK